MSHKGVMFTTPTTGVSVPRGGKVKMMITIIKLNDYYIYLNDLMFQGQRLL